MGSPLIPELSQDDLCQLTSSKVYLALWLLVIIIIWPVKLMECPFGAMNSSLTHGKQRLNLDATVVIQMLIL